MPEPTDFRRAKGAAKSALMNEHRFNAAYVRNAANLLRLVCKGINQLKAEFGSYKSVGVCYSLITFTSITKLIYS